MRKYLSITFGILFLGVNCIFAYAPESSFWAERQELIEKAKKHKSQSFQLARLSYDPRATTFSDRDKEEDFAGAGLMILRMLPN